MLVLKDGNNYHFSNPTVLKLTTLNNQSSDYAVKYCVEFVLDSENHHHWDPNRESLCFILLNTL